MAAVAHRVGYSVGMCLIVFAWRADPRWPLVLVANRDEFHARPAAPAACLADAPDVFGGRDLLAGGSWLLVSQRRRLAAITNVRVGLAAEAAPRSRGELVREFVAGDMDAAGFAATFAPRAQAYGRFNLLLWDGQAMRCVGNHPRFRDEPVTPGLHGLSNAHLDAGWPKALRVQSALAAWLGSEAAAGADVQPEPLFEALADTAPAADARLPDTGIGLELERRLSSPFVRGDTYGTRCSTFVLAGSGSIGMIERRFAANGVRSGEGRLGTWEH